MLIKPLLRITPRYDILVTVIAKKFLFPFYLMRRHWLKKTNTYSKDQKTVMYVCFVLCLRFDKQRDTDPHSRIRKNKVPVYSGDK